MDEFGYGAASAILEDCHAGKCPNAPKANEVILPKGGGTLHTCNECWNRHVFARRAARKRELAAHKVAAAGYWKSRGISVGETVIGSGWHLLHGPFPIEGVAKVGSAGPYVHIPGKSGQFEPGQFRKAS